MRERERGREGKGEGSEVDEGTEGNAIEKRETKEADDEKWKPWRGNNE